MTVSTRTPGAFYQGRRKNAIKAVAKSAATALIAFALNLELKAQFSGGCGLRISAGQDCQTDDCAFDSKN